MVVWYICRDIFFSKDSTFLNIFWGWPQVLCLQSFFSLFCLTSEMLRTFLACYISPAFLLHLLPPLAQSTHICRRWTLSSTTWKCDLKKVPDACCNSICTWPCHLVPWAEEQRSAEWLMLQPHPLDQRHNYIVISWTTPTLQKFYIWFFAFVFCPYTLRRDSCCSIYAKP